MKPMLFESYRVVALTMLIGLVLLRTTADAQEPEHEGEIEGVVRDADTGEPLAGAFVAVVGTGTSAVTHGDGTFHLTGIAGGSYSLRVERLGYRSRTSEVTVGDESAVVAIELTTSPIALQGMVVTGTLSERAAAEALRPVSVLAGDALQRRSEATVAATLASMPGMAAISMGPAVSQPVVRGLSGDRVLMLEDGTPVGDASNSGTDHATALDPSSARRIEIVRGPGALLYGGNALGGVVNVIRDEIPSSVPHHVTGSTTLQSQSVTGALGGSATAVFPVAERVPLRLEVAARTAGDLKTPVGTLPNTNGRLWTGGAGTAYVADWGHLGGSFRSYRNDYGIPGGFVGGHEEGVRIEMQRYASKFQAVAEEPAGFFEDIRFAATHTWYEHREIEPPDILGTLFRQQAASGDILGRHAAWGPFAAGAMGARLSWEDFTYGGSLYTPDTRRLRAAMYLLEEVDLGSARIEWGLRYDWTRADPLEEDRDSDIGEIRDRSFHALSGSMGVLLNPVSGLTLGASVVRAFRSPDVDELYSEGPHLAAYAFEVGNPSLESEIGRGFDIFLRFESDRVRGEVTGFYNDIRGYVYGEDTDRLSRVLLPIYQFQSNDAVFSGFEAGVDVDIGGGFALEAVASTVQGSLKGTDQPLPLVPPLRGHTALKYERPLWFIRGEAEMAASQDRIGEFETATDGYTVLNLSTGTRITLGGRLNVLAVSLNNVRDTVYRNHLSRVKEIMPEAGRGLDLTYRVVF
ncbi:MAG: TonB-dependent receptor [Gemmatimonadetes bacterium]|nr:TonB-dependent receptor [Gemmatimonadota bacterium]MYE92784.1 TonB-dependent receptor [Gemmatimonadota bacterium]MYJ09346.1 TonB-dependent receptor [Gemmatimonadota bacterium]